MYKSLMGRRMIFQSEMKEGLGITVVSKRQQLDSIMKAWEELHKAEVNPVPDVDPYLYVCELESLGHHVEPYILCLRRQGPDRKRGLASCSRRSRPR